MLHSTTNLRGLKAMATDGQMGKVVDFIFDGTELALRYVVVDTGNLFAERNRYVLISTCAIGEPDWESGVLPLSCTMTEVRSSPDLELEKPISKEALARLHEHYNWSVFWSGYGQPISPGIAGKEVPVEEREEVESPEDEYLWTGYGQPVGHMVADIRPEKK
jgi:hypothetical protein